MFGVPARWASGRRSASFMFHCRMQLACRAARNRGRSATVPKFSGDSPLSASSTQSPARESPLEASTQRTDGGQPGVLATSGDLQAGSRAASELAAPTPIHQNFTKETRKLHDIFTKSPDIWVSARPMALELRAGGLKPSQAKSNGRLTRSTHGDESDARSKSRRAWARLGLPVGLAAARRRLPAAPVL